MIVIVKNKIKNWNSFSVCTVFEFIVNFRYISCSASRLHNNLRCFIEICKCFVFVIHFIPFCHGWRFHHGAFESNSNQNKTWANPSKHSHIYARNILFSPQCINCRDVMRTSNVEKKSLSLDRNVCNKFDEMIIIRTTLDPKTVNQRISSRKPYQSR